MYQGDILLNKQQEDDLRTSKARGAGLRLWPGGVVPYVISHELGKYNGRDRKVEMVSFELGEELRKMFFRLVTSVGQRKNSESP